MSLLRDRMSSDMEHAGLAPGTRNEYISAIRRMAEFFRRDPVQLRPEDIRAWDEEMKRRGYGPDWRGIQVAALRFLYLKTLSRPDMVSFLVFHKKPRRLPVVLSAEEVFRVLGAIQEPRFHAFFALLFDTGLRISEAAQLKAEDIERGRGVIHVLRGKGGKDRQVKLGDRLYELLRAYWRDVRTPGPKVGPLSREALLFVNLAGGPLCFTSARRALTLAAQAAGITKRVTPHSLRHAYATAQLEAGTDLRVLQAQLGHASIRSTQIYLHVSTRLIRQAPSPLDDLPPS